VRDVRTARIAFARLFFSILVIAACLASMPAALFASTVPNPVDPGERTAPAPDPDATEPPPPRRGPPLGLNFRVRGGATYQFPTKLKGGGEFTTSRTVLDVGARYGFTENFSAIVSVSYGYEPYNFSDSVQIGGLQPWTAVNTLRISAPIFWNPAPRWSLLFVPILRFQAEEVSSWDDSISGGGIFSFSYKFGKRLRVGPGIGVLSEIEDKPTIFPVLLIDWQITDRFALTTGRGLGASGGPGLAAEFEFRKLWTTSLGFRFERNRFRLAPRAGNAGGVGEDEGFPVFATLQVGPRYAFVALVTGAEFRGKLRIEDASGNFIAEREYKPSAFIGMTGQIFF
jgi:hypothetical protein